VPFHSIFADLGSPNAGYLAFSAGRFAAAPNDARLRSRPNEPPRMQIQWCTLGKPALMNSDNVGWSAATAVL
jgi:hypothetical protein